MAKRVRQQQRGEERERETDEETVRVVAALGELGNIELPTGRDNKLTEQTTKPNQTSPSQTIAENYIKIKAQINNMRGNLTHNLPVYTPLPPSLLSATPLCSNCSIAR